VEHTPDTVITLVDGHKLVIEEPLETVVAMVRTWHASVAAEATTLAHLAGDAANAADMASAANAAAAIRTKPIDDAVADTNDAVAAADTAPDSQLGRVLRLPSREV
jgi:flagellar protein FlbD